MVLLSTHGDRTRKPEGAAFEEFYPKPESSLIQEIHEHDTIFPRSSELLFAQTSEKDNEAVPAVEDEGDHDNGVERDGKDLLDMF